MDDQIKKLEQKSEALEKEYDELASLLESKKAEISGLASGLEKYKGNSSMISQMDGIISKRLEEVKTINQRVLNLRNEYKKVQNEMSQVFSKMNVQRNKAIVETPKIADSPAVSKAIEKAIEIGQKTEAKKPFSFLKRKEEKKPVVVEKPKEAEVKAPKLVKPLKPDLYNKAAEEARAQEEFLKKNAPKTFGSA